MRIQVDDSVTDEVSDLVWAVYESVFGDVADQRAWRETVWDRHCGRAGFRLARIQDGRRLVGFAYGYTGEAGQWWTDNARQVLAPHVAAAWLGGHFELVSIGVLASARSAGVGRRLLRVLLEDLPHQRLLLMTTADASDPARRLYASEGWRVLGPGIGDATVIMGRRNPQTPGPAS